MENYPKIPKLKKFRTKNSKDNNKKSSNGGSVYNPTIGELLKIPDQLEGEKTTEDVPDVMMAERGMKHEEEMSCVDAEI